RNKMFALDFATQAQQMKAIGGQPDYALGSARERHADAVSCTGRQAGFAGTGDEADLPAAAQACLLAPAGAVGHVEEGLAVQVPSEVVGEQPSEGLGHIRLTAGGDMRCQQDLG